MMDTMHSAIKIRCVQSSVTEVEEEVLHQEEHNYLSADGGQFRQRFQVVTHPHHVEKWMRCKNDRENEEKVLENNAFCNFASSDGIWGSSWLQSVPMQPWHCIAQQIRNVSKPVTEFVYQVHCGCPQVILRYGGYQ